MNCIDCQTNKGGDFYYNGLNYCWDCLLEINNLEKKHKLKMIKKRNYCLKCDKRFTPSEPRYFPQWQKFYDKNGNERYDRHMCSKCNIEEYNLIINRKNIKELEKKLDDYEFKFKNLQQSTGYKILRILGLINETTHEGGSSTSLSR